MFPLLVFTVLILLIDLYAYKGLKLLLDRHVNRGIKIILKIAYWLVPLLLLTSVIFVIYLKPIEVDPRIFNASFYIIAFALMFYLPKLVFIIFQFIEDMVFIVEKTVRVHTKHSQNIKKPKIYPLHIKRKYFSRTGILIAIIPFIAIIYGMVIGRFDFQITKVTIESKTLPASFDGLKIVHISDIHIGSFFAYKDKMIRAVELINKQDPDIIFFTGDLVNNFTSELDGFIEILAGMTANYGKYSVLGNHDYGDYYQWDSDLAKEKNMQDMLVAQENIGFRLLMNEWDSLLINSDKLAIIGVENWGNPPFPRYGDLKKASKGTEQYPFRILLTHDPSHWDAEVIDNYNIDLTLAGHTHGMQVGIEAGNFRWSPSQLRYPRWGGLYKESEQYLYVNRGLGFIAFPGRIGMPPEITVIELRVAR